MNLVKENLIIAPHYLPEIVYFFRFLDYKRIVFNDSGNFIKQTCRNRAYILTANGVSPLIIPLKKGKTHLSYKDVQIDHKLNWERVHWQTIISAYNKAPYFLYYRDKFEKYYQTKTKFLIDFNIQLISVIIDILALKNSISFLSVTSKTDEGFNAGNTVELKTGKNDVKKLLINKCSGYTQVFSDRFDFVPNLSIIDLIFNSGPESNTILENI